MVAKLLSVFSCILISFDVQLSHEVQCRFWGCVILVAFDVFVSERYGERCLGLDDCFHYVPIWLEHVVGNMELLLAL